jgi:molybdenum cofactor guanylyltransferase
MSEAISDCPPQDFIGVRTDYEKKDKFCYDRNDKLISSPGAATMAIKIDTIILAGGKSSRMGRDKAKIEFKGQPLLRRIYDVAAPWSDRVYVVTPWIENYRDLLPLECQWIEEQPPHQGPLLGFRQGLPWVQQEWVLLLACDLPNLSGEIIQQGMAGLTELSPLTLAHLPRHPDKGWEPLCGYYRTSCQASLDRYLLTGQKSFQTWLDRISVTELTIVDRDRYLYNCNTPDDLDKLL